MSDLISKDALYRKIAELEDLARSVVLDTPKNNSNFMRYVAHLNERTAFKHMVADEPAVEAISKDRVEAAVNVLRQIDWVGSGAKAMIEEAIGILVEEKKDETMVEKT